MSTEAAGVDASSEPTSLPDITFNFVTAASRQGYIFTPDLHLRCIADLRSTINVQTKIARPDQVIKMGAKYAVITQIDVGLFGCSITQSDQSICLPQEVHLTRR